MDENAVLRRNGYVVSRNLSSRLVPLEILKPLGRETRKHPASQLRKLAGRQRAIRRVGRSFGSRSKHETPGDEPGDGPF
jgi:hypothetical protein